MNCDNCGLNGNDCSRGDGSDCAPPRPFHDANVWLDTHAQARAAREAGAMTHDKDVLISNPCAWCAGQGECDQVVNCGQYQAWCSILARYDALVVEHEAHHDFLYGTTRTLMTSQDAHDHAERMMKGEGDE